MDRRRLVLIDAGDHIIRELDVSDIDHASVQAEMHLEVHTRCDMGEWHRDQRIQLMPWGTAIRKPS